MPVTSCDLGSKPDNTVVKNLNELLADEYGLFTKTLNYHWNVTGKNFKSLHVFFEEQYRSLLEMMDEVAERVRYLGARPLGTVVSLEKKMNISESDGKSLSEAEMIEDLLRAHNSIHEEIKNILKVPNLSDEDPGTGDFLGSLLRKHEEMSWMLKSHLQ